MDEEGWERGKGWIKGGGREEKEKKWRVDERDVPQLNC